MIKLIDVAARQR